MKKISLRMISIVFFLIFTIILSPAFAVQSNDAGLIDDAVDKPSTAFAQDLNAKSNTDTKYLIEDSAFHRFIKRAKGNLAIFGQRMTFVLSNYSKAPSESVKALSHLAEARGMGQLVKIILLFVLLIASGFGVERLFNITIQKHKQQLQGTIPKSFLQLIARLSARTVLELISLAVFALTILGIYLLFYPTQSPLHELAMIYLPPIFIMRLAFIVLNALYSPKAPHMRVAPQNCPSAATYLIGSPHC